MRWYRLWNKCFVFLQWLERDDRNTTEECLSHHISHGNHQKSVVNNKQIFYEFGVIDRKWKYFSLEIQSFALSIQIH